jgi:hypothetical protein
MALAYVSLLCFPCVTTDLRKQKVNTKGRAFIIEVSLQFSDLLLEHLWRVPNTANDTKTASICNCGGQFGARSDVHAGEKNWVVDLEEIGDWRPDLFYSPRVSVQFLLCVLKTYEEKTWSR